MDDFYFAYGYNSEKKTADRLYRLQDSQFERYNPNKNTWEPAPEQACILIGEDWEYDEITQEQATELSVFF